MAFGNYSSNIEKRTVPYLVLRRNEGMIKRFIQKTRIKNGKGARLSLSAKFVG
jgi:hypothetical protein